jgi:hypothetical protein
LPRLEHEEDDRREHEEDDRREELPVVQPGRERMACAKLRGVSGCRSTPAAGSGRAGLNLKRLQPGQS